MDISLVLKTVGVGIIVALAAQILQRSGRDEQATLVTVVGIIVVFVMIISEVGELLQTIRSVFEI